MLGNLSDSQKWHYDNLVKKYHEWDEDQDYPFYISMYEYFQEEDGPELEDYEYAKVIEEFIKFYKKEHTR